MAHDVFISHSAKNKATGDALCAALESHGIRCWIAPRDVTAGMEWGECIIEAIKRARIMVLVFTAEANASPQVRREVERAANHRVTILPMRMEKVLPDKALEYFIGNVHWFDAITPPLEPHLQALADTINTLLERAAGSKEQEIGAPVRPIEVQWPLAGAHGETGSQPRTYPLPGARHKKWTRLALSIAALVVLAGGAAYQFYSRSRPASAADVNAHVPAVKARQSVAVLGFENLGSKDQAWIGTALSEMLSTELAAGETLRTVPGQDVARTMAELSLADISTYNKSTLAKIRDALGSDYVITGSFLASGARPADSIRADVHLQATSTGDMVRSVSETGTLAELPKLLDAIGVDLRNTLGVQNPSEADTKAAKASLTSNPGALQRYAEGLAKLRILDALGARDELETAVSLDPNFALAHSALADAWQILGYDQNAQQEAKKALELSTPLSQVDRRSIEARYNKMTNGWAKAIEIYSALWGVYDDEPNYALELASVQTAAGKGQDALNTLEDLRKRPDLNIAARIDLEEAAAAASLSNIKLQQSYAARAADEASRQGARYLAAQAYWRNCSALLALGDVKGAENSCNKGSDSADFAGGQQAKARNITVLANIMEKQGPSQRAATMALRQQAWQIAQQIGSRKDMIGALVNLANLLSEEGNSADARTNYQKAIELAGEIGDNQQLATLQMDLGADYYTQGDTARAGTLYAQSLRSAQLANDKIGIAGALQSLAMLSLQLGDLSNARKNIDQAISISQGVPGLQSAQAISLSTLGDIQMAQGDLSGAQKTYQHELNIFTQLGDQANVASARVSLAKLAQEQGNASGAEILARQAVQELQADSLVDSEADAMNVLAQALLAQGKLADAKAQIDAISKIPVQDRGVKMSIAITSAQIQARSGMVAEALKNLNSTLQQAIQLKSAGGQLETELVRAEVTEMSDSKAGLAALQALGKQATSRGYALIAGKASRQVQLASK